MMRIHTYKMIILIFALAACSSIGFSQTDEQVTIESELSRSRVYVGDEITYQIIVRGSNNPPTPTIKFPDSVRALSHGRSSQTYTTMRIINGRNRTVTDRRFSYQYTLTAVETGTIILPAPTIQINGQTIKGTQSSFESIFPVLSDTDELIVRIEREQVYLNETIEVECTWWIADQTTEPSLASSSIPDSFRVRGLEPNFVGRQQVGLGIAGQHVPGVVDSGIHNGQEATKLVFRISISPTAVGTFDLGPIRAVFTRRSGIGNNYRAYVESDPIKIRVIPVPTAGQPDRYTGAVGAYQLSTYASNTAVSVGDPIELTLQIKGREPMVGVDDAPDLEYLPAFSDQFKVSSDGWRETLPRKSGTRIYKTTIRALTDQATQIPSVKLPSFNTTTGKYRVYQSNPIDISVASVEEITLSDAVINRTNPSSEPEQSIDRVELTRSMPGLWAHGSTQDMYAKPGFSFIKSLNDPLWIAVLSTGPSAFLLSLIFVFVRHKSDPQSRALSRALRTSRSLEKKGMGAIALRTYIAAALDINQNTVTANDASRLPISQSNVDAVATTLRELEQSEYVDENENTQSQSALRPGLLRELHTQIKQSRSKS